MRILRSLLTVPEGPRRHLILAVLGVVSIAAGVAAGMLIFDQDGGESARGDARLVTAPTAPGPATATAGAPATGTVKPTKNAVASEKDQDTGEKTRRAGAREGTAPSTSKAPKRTVTSEPATRSTSTTPAAPKVPDVSGQFLIRNQGTGFCFDLPNYQVAVSGDRTTQYHCQPGDQDNQEFEVAEQSGSQFLLRNVKSQFCLDTTDTGSVPAGSDISLWACIGGDTDNMVYRAEAAAAGWRLVHVKSRLCVDVSTADGAADQPDRKLALTTCSASPTQIWTFEH